MSRNSSTGADSVKEAGFQTAPNSTASIHKHVGDLGQQAERELADAKDCAAGMLKSLAATFVGIQALAAEIPSIRQLAMVGAELAEDYLVTIESFRTAFDGATAQPRSGFNHLPTAASNMRKAIDLARQSEMSNDDHQVIDGLLENIREAFPNSSRNIVMTGTRAKRFSWSISDIADLTTSLESSAKHFPEHFALTPGQVAPVLAVEIFTAGITKRLELLYSMMSNEDEQEATNGGA